MIDSLICLQEITKIWIPLFKYEYIDKHYYKTLSAPTHSYVCIMSQQKHQRTNTVFLAYVLYTFYLPYNLTNPPS